jgi:LmbE family N-acetylglucosaminyl deacetylase
MSTEPISILAFGAHPDDIEFGCGGVIARETRTGSHAHFVICSRGESATNGTPAERTREAEKGARLLGATVEFLKLDGDCRLEASPANAFAVAGILRRVRPALVLAPSVVPNQHPDHYRLGEIVRDAARLARYGGVKELRRAGPHRIEHLLFYAVTPDAEPQDLSKVLIDISPPEIIAAWTEAMEAHASQLRTRNYVEMQLTRARMNGLRAGIGYAIALFANDPPVLDSLRLFGRAARQF